MRERSKLSRKQQRMRNRQFDIHESGKDDRLIILFGVHLEIMETRNEVIIYFPGL